MLPLQFDYDVSLLLEQPSVVYTGIREEGGGGVEGVGGGGGGEEEEELK
jgi:hypothetical protein